MQWISNIFWKSWNLIYGISEKYQKFIIYKMLEIKSQHLTWGGPNSSQEVDKAAIGASSCQLPMLAITFYYLKPYGCRLGKYNVIPTNTACWTYNIYA